MERFDIFSFDGKTFLVDEAGMFYLKEDGLQGLGATKLRLNTTRVPFGLPPNISLSDPRRFRGNSLEPHIDRKPFSLIDTIPKIEPPKIIPVDNVINLGKPKPDFLNSFTKLATQVGSIFGNKQNASSISPRTTITQIPTRTGTSPQPKHEQHGNHWHSRCGADWWGNRDEQKESLIFIVHF